jgi:methyl-accepting chemotaxis protein
LRPSATPSPAKAVLPARSAELSSQLVPVWRRQVEAAREHSAASAEGLMESFGRIASHVDTALGLQGQGAQLELSAIDALIEGHQPKLDTLLNSTRRAVAAKDRMLAEVEAIGRSLDEMVQLSKEVQTIARATHLLSMNATVEAARSGQGQGQGGVGVVAEEVRRLAAQSRQAGTRLAKLVGEMQERMTSARLDARREDTADDELTLQAEESARAVIAGLMDSLSHVNRTSRSIRQAGKQLQKDIESIFIEMQSQDRLSQQLGAVTGDMARYVAWCDGADDPAAASVARWLDRLESTYTMEDQRSSHHSTVAVDRAPAVEFF